MHNLIKLPDVLARLSMSRTTFYDKVKKGVIPPPISLGDRAVAWVEAEIDQTITALIAGKTKEEMKGMVKSLIHQRKQ